MSIVICDLPKAGLGNQLFPLMKAAVFAKLNGLPLAVTGYSQFKIGPYLRSEKSKRKYNGYFTFQRGPVGRQMDKLALLKYRKFLKVGEPDLKVMPQDQLSGKRYFFSAIPHWSDYFAGLREYRDLVIPLLRNIIREDIWEEMAALQTPCIGVHIRMGDFRKLKEGEDFSTVGTVRTPEQYFIDIINSIRRINGRDLPVSIFSDGYKEELKNIFSLENVSMVEGNRDIIDMLLLSKSKFIITSAGSTFSYWSGFLSDAALIMHHDHIHSFVRPENVNGKSYEGPFDHRLTDDLLTNNIKNAG